MVTLLDRESPSDTTSALSSLQRNRADASALDPRAIHPDWSEIRDRRLAKSHLQGWEEVKEYRPVA